MASRKKSVGIRVLEQIARPPTNEMFIASDLRLSETTVRRAVREAIDKGLVERVDVEGYEPHLELTRDGRDLLREQKPGWWKTRSG